MTATQRPNASQHAGRGRRDSAHLICVFSVVSVFSVWNESKRPVIGGPRGRLYRLSLTSAFLQASPTHFTSPVSVFTAIDPYLDIFYHISLLAPQLLAVILACWLVFPEPCRALGPLIVCPRARWLFWCDSLRNWPGVIGALTLMNLDRERVLYGQRAALRASFIKRWFFIEVSSPSLSLCLSLSLSLHAVSYWLLAQVRNTEELKWALFELLHSPLSTGPRTKDLRVCVCVCVCECVENVHAKHPFMSASGIQGCSGFSGCCSCAVITKVCVCVCVRSLIIHPFNWETQ